MKTGTTDIVSTAKLDGHQVWHREKDTWDGWCAQAPHPSFFCTSDWLETWWETYGGAVEPWILRVRREGTDIGYAPLMRVVRRPLPGMRVRSIEFIGTGERVCPEYLDVIARPGELGRVRRAVGDYLSRNRQEWDRLWLTDGLAGNSLSDFIIHDAHHGNKTRKVNSHICPYIDLPEDWDALLSAFGRHMRRKIRQIAHRVEREQNVRWRVHAADDDPEQAVAVMTDLHTRARELKGETGNFVDPDYRRLHTSLIRRAAKSGHLYLGFLELGRQPAAFYYGFVYGKIFFNYQTGFNPAFAHYRPGWYAVARMMQDLIERGCTRVDFLRGDHDYKWHWATGWHETVTAAVFSRNFTGQVNNWLHRARQAIRKPHAADSGPPAFVRPRLNKAANSS